MLAPVYAGIHPAWADPLPPSRWLLQRNGTHPTGMHSCLANLFPTTATNCMGAPIDPPMNLLIPYSTANYWITTYLPKGMMEMAAY